MRVIDALVVWTPGNYELNEFAPTRGQIDVCDTTEDDWDWKEKYRHFWGAADNRWKQQPHLMRVQMMFAMFHTIVIRDEIEFEAVHAAFMKIDDYREALLTWQPLEIWQKNQLE